MDPSPGNEAQEVNMRWCAYCNTSFGSMEGQTVVDGNVLHERCEKQFRRFLADRAASRGIHRLLHLPSLKDPCADEPAGFGDGKL